MTDKKTKPILPPGIHVVILGIEGELIETEELHYQKWFKIAKKAGVVAEEEAFRVLWEEKLSGSGDKKVYEELQKRVPPGEKIPSWEECQKINNEYYKENLSSAEFPKDVAESVIKLRMKGVRVMIVTHAPEELVRMQLEHIEKKTGLTFDFEKDVVIGERKDGEGYVVAFDRVNEERARAGLAALEHRNVLVLDNSEKYLARATRLSMRAARVLSSLPGHLKPNVADQSIPTLGWPGLYRAIADGLKPGGASVPTLKHTL